MSQDGNSTAEATLAPMTADFEDMKKAVAAARDTAIAEIGLAKTAIASGKSIIDSALAEIEQAKTTTTTAKSAVDAALVEIDKIKTASATAKGAIEAIQSTASNDLATITSTKNELEKLKAAAIAQKESLESENKAVRSKIDDLHKKIDVLEQTLGHLSDIKDSAEADRASVTAAVDQITKASQSFQTLLSQAQQNNNDLATQLGALKSKISEITKAHGDVQGFSMLLFDDTGGKTSIKTGINVLQKQIAEVLDQGRKENSSAQQSFAEFQSKAIAAKESLLSEAQKEFNQLYLTLEGEIRALLPSAGAAGLSSTYYDAKSRYAWTSFAGKPGARFSNDANPVKRLVQNIRRVFGYNPINLFSTIFFYLLFIVPIVAIVWIFWDLLHNLPSDKVKNLDVAIVALRILIALPLAAISAFGFISLNLYRRLFEEFNYKQRVMELYSSFSKEIAQAGSEEQKKALLSVMIETVSDRSYLAKGTIEGRDDQEILNKLNSISSIVANLAKAKAG